MKKCDLKLDLLEILCGFSHLFGLPTQRFSHVVRPSSTLTSVWAAGIVLPQEARRHLTHNIIHIDLQPLERLVAAQMVPHHKVFPTCLPLLLRDRVRQKPFLQLQISLKRKTPNTWCPSASSPATLSHYILSYNKEPSVFIKWMRKWQAGVRERRAATREQTSCKTCSVLDTTSWRSVATTLGNNLVFWFKKRKNQNTQTFRMGRKFLLSTPFCRKCNTQPQILLGRHILQFSQYSVFSDLNQ